MSKINLESFNKILFEAMKDGVGEKDLIEAELNCIGHILIEKCGYLLDELEANDYDSKIFREIKNIKNNSEHLVLRMMELEKEEKKNG